MMLRATNLAFAYRGGAPVLRDVSLTIEPGRISVLLGPNGCGKSTLLKLLLGMLRMDRGEIEWDGRPIGSYRSAELARNVAYLPQAPAHDEGQIVAEVLRAGRTPYLGAFGIESAHDVEVVLQTAKMLELNELLDRPMEKLSGGQRQRVFLGRALAQEPRALLLDEPTTFLDLQHQAQLWKILQMLAREKNLAILAASHDLNMAAAFADELMLLHERKIVASGGAAAVLDAELLTRVYHIPMERIEHAGARPVVFPRV